MNKNNNSSLRKTFIDHTFPKYEPLQKKTIVMATWECSSIVRCGVGWGASWLQVKINESLKKNALQIITRASRTI